VYVHWQEFCDFCHPKTTNGSPVTVSARAITGLTDSDRSGALIHQEVYMLTHDLMKNSVGMAIMQLSMAGVDVSGSKLKTLQQKILVSMGDCRSLSEALFSELDKNKDGKVRIKFKEMAVAIMVSVVTVCWWSSGGSFAYFNGVERQIMSHCICLFLSFLLSLTFLIV
jgi:hypothetical protein